MYEFIVSPYNCVNSIRLIFKKYLVHDHNSSQNLKK